MGPIDWMPGVAELEAQYEAAAAVALAQGALAAIAAANAIHGAAAVQIGRAVYDGRFSELELRNLPVIVGATVTSVCCSHAHAHLRTGFAAADPAGGDRRGSESVRANRT